MATCLLPLLSTESYRMITRRYQRALRQYASPCQKSISSLMTHSHRPSPSKCAQALHELLLLCFQKDVDRRITADKLLKHPWIGAAKHRQHTTALSDVSTHHEVIVIFVLHLTWLARCTGGKQDRRTSHEARHGDSDSID